MYLYIVDVEAVAFSEAHDHFLFAEAAQRHLTARLSKHDMLAVHVTPRTDVTTLYVTEYNKSYVITKLSFQNQSTASELSLAAYPHIVTALSQKPPFNY